MEEIKSTGNISVDMIISAIAHYNRVGKKVSQIVLRYDYYKALIAFIEVDQKIDLDTKLTFGDVEILSGEEMDEDRYFMADPMMFYFSEPEFLSKL